MPTTHDHPPASLLDDFALGRLDDSRWVEDHLAECPDCQLRAAAARGDSLTELLAAAGAAAGDRPTPTLAADYTPSLDAPTQGYAPAAGPAPDGPPPELAAHPKYRVVRRLGAGGMGTVWLAEHAVMNRSVAVKVIRPDLLARPGAADRFLREVRSAAKLQHPNIVTAFDAEPAGESCLFVMEYVPGRTLAEEVKDGPLPAAAACRAARDAARGLAAAHAAGLVHRDVKPANLIRAADGTVKVLDFGLAGAAAVDDAGSGDRLTGAGMVFGTPDYIAPEQADDPRTAGPAADVYGLGCTLYHLLAGRPPFPDGPPLAKLAAHRTATPAPVPGLPAGLAAVLAKMTAKRPGDRYRTAEDAAAALEPFCRPARRPRWPLAVAAGLLFAAVAVAGTIVIVRDKNGKEVARVTVPDGGKVEVAPAPPPAEVRDWKFPVVQRFPGHSWVVGGVALSPDGRLAATAGDNDPQPFLRLWDVAAGKEVRRFEGHQGVIHCPHFTPDGKHLVSSGRDGTARLWEVATGREVRQFAGHDGEVWGLAVSADGTHVLTGCHDKVLRLFEVASGKEVRRFEGHTDAVSDVALSADGRRALSCSADRTARVWDLATGMEVRRVSYEWAVRCVAISPDGRLALTSGCHADNRGMVAVWEVETGKEVRRLDGHRGPVYRVAFTPDGRRALSAGHDSTYRLWDVETGRELGWREEEADECYELAVSRDGRHVLVGGTNVTDPKLLELPNPSPNPPGELRQFGADDHRVIRLALAPDGKRVLTAGGDGTARYWDVATGKELHRLPHAFGQVYGAAVTPDGTTLLSSGEDAQIRVWDAASGRPLKQLRGHTANVAGVAVAPNGWLVASAGYDYSVRLWNLETGEALATLDWPTGWLQGVTFSPDGKRLAAWGYGNTVRVWDVETRKEVRRLEGHTEMVRAAKFTPDGTRLVSGSWAEDGSGCLKVWEVATGALVRTIDSSSGVHGLAVTADGRRVLSGGHDRRVYLWDLESGQDLADFKGHNRGAVTDVAFLPDGRTALSAGVDGTVRVWRLPEPPAAKKP